MALKANNVLIKSIEANNNMVGTAVPIVWKTPLDFADFDGENIWTDGDNIYFSFRTTQYQLDQTTFVWVKKHGRG